MLRAEFLVDATALSKMQGTPFRPVEIEEAISRCSEVQRDDHRRAGDHQEGLELGPRGALVPGLRGLLDPRRGPDAPARPRRAPGEHRVPLGHRLCRPLPLLHEHLRAALDPRRAPAIATGLATTRRTWTCGSSPATAMRSPLGGTTSSTRCGATCASRSSCSTTRSTASRRGSTRRRRRWPRSPSRRRSVGGRAFNPVSSRSAPRPPSWLAPMTWTAPTCRRPSAGPTSTTARLRRGLPELQRLQRRRVRGDHGKEVRSTC